MVEAQELGQQEQAPATSSYRMSDWKVGVWGFWNAALRRPEAVSPVSSPTASKESSRDRSAGERFIVFLFWRRAPRFGWVDLQL